MCKKLIYLASFVLVLGVTAGVTNADLVAYWPFDEGAGDVAYDAIGENDGQITGCTWVTPGKVGAAAIEGSGGDEINCGPGPTPTTEDLTLAWWMVDNHSSWGTIMDKSVTGSGYGYNILVRPDSEPSPLIFRIGGWQSYGGWGVECCVPQGAYSDGVWVHVACTYDSATDTAKIYIDGVLAENPNNLNPKTGIAGPTGYCDGVNNPDTPLYIRGGEESFDGMMDEVAIWDNALTADEVLDVYTLGVLALDPRQASSPNPADEEPDVSRKPVLSWKPGVYADKHDVYFADNFDDVNDASNLDPMGPDNVYRARQDANSYAVPETLDFGQTYYWRIDEVNAPPYTNTVFRGKIWQFTVEPFAYPIDGNNITATASSSNNEAEGPENTINGSGLDDDDLHSIVQPDMWLSAEGGPQPTWIQYEFDKVYKLHQMLVWNHNTGFEAWLGFGFKDVTVEYSTDGTNWTELGGVPEFARAPGQADYAANTTVDFSGAVAKYVKLTVNSNWGTFDQYGLSEVRFLYIPVRARYPSPQDEATGVGPDVVLSWRAGRDADTHDVYLSSRKAVVNGTVPAITVTEASYDAGTLDLGETYYWKITEVNMAETPTSWEGDVWSFATPEYFVVEDFEDYNDYHPDRVFETWKGGYGWTAGDDYAGYCGNGTGSAVGHATVPYAEQTIVHGGGQSMPVYYDNSGTGTNSCGQPINLYYSETERTFDTPQDWTRAGVRALTLYFHGDPDNDAGATEQMYVKVNGAKVVYDGDMADIKQASWHEWNIDLASFAGVNLQSVTKVGIGLGTGTGPGGSGVVYFDDIRLYPSRCVPERKEPPAADLNNDCVVDYLDIEIMSADWLLTGDAVATSNPGSANLLVEYTFDAGNLTDTSGNNYHGIGQNAPGVHDGILTLYGANFVDIPLGANNPFDGSQDFSIAMDFRTGQANILISSARDDTPDNHAMAVYMVTGAVVYDNFWVGAAGNDDSPLDGTWHNVVVVYSAADEQITVWLDASSDTSWGGQFNPAIPNIEADTVRIGGSLNATFPYEAGAEDFVGDIDNVRIYGRALTAAEIAYLVDDTPGDGLLYLPAASLGNVYDGEAPLSWSVNLKDLAELANSWLDEQLWP